LGKLEGYLLQYQAHATKCRLVGGLRRDEHLAAFGDLDNAAGGFEQGKVQFAHAQLVNIPARRVKRGGHHRSGQLLLLAFQAARHHQAIFADDQCSGHSVNRNQTVQVVVHVVSAPFVHPAHAITPPSQQAST
jgi:hypothetical protein